MPVEGATRGLLEGDEEEASKMALRLAEVLLEKLERADDALAALVPFARAGDEPCREEYERLGDSLGKQEEVAEGEPKPQPPSQ